MQQKLIGYDMKRMNSNSCEKVTKKCQATKVLRIFLQFMLLVCYYWKSALKLS